MIYSIEIFTPGRTDWSRPGLVATFMGEGWKRDMWSLYPDGTGMIQVSHGGNSQSSSFSPGGRHIAYTAYTNVQAQDEFGCEIFLMDLYSGESRHLTNNDICDYQPRWAK